MRWNISLVAGVVLVAVASLASANDAVHWAGDFKQACDVAAQQKRLVLLHFYSDNCPPCVRFDKEVFNQPQVAEAVERYCVPVKVHVEQSPELARKYNIQRWPTDVIVTPAGLEVFRTVGFRGATEYTAMVEQVALHAGARPAAGGQVPLTAAAPPQASPYPGPYQGGPVAGTYQSQLPPSDRNNYQSSIGPATHQNLDTYRQPFAANPGQPSGETPDVAPVGNPMGPMSPAAPPHDPRYAAAPPAGNTLPLQPAGNMADPNASIYQPQAAYGAPPANAPAASVYQSAGAVAAAVAPVPQPVTNRYTQQYEAAPPAATYAPPQVAQGPQLQAPSQQAPIAPSAPATAPTAGPYSMQPPFAAASPPAAQAPLASAAPGQMVPSNAAPPVVLDGCCAVTMVETRKLKKADARFGAVHRGRTYLFMSADEQTKFLADPDRYAVILSGYDPVRFAKTGELVEGKREFGMMYQQKIYLMADEAALNEFNESPQVFSTAAHQAMLRSETTGTQFR